MRSWTITYQGDDVSLNKMYAGLHWTARKKLVDKYHNIFTILLLEARVPKIDKFRVDVKFNSRLDSDNTIPMIKFLVDSMKGKYIVDDTKKYFRGFSITPEESLDKKTYVFTISEV